MNTDRLCRSTRHEEFLTLLPWYVNGTLSGEERDRVVAHVRSCLVCRRELALERRTQEIFRGESPQDQSARAAFERLQNRIIGGRRRFRASSRRGLKPVLWRLRAIVAGHSDLGLRPALAAISLFAAVFAVVLINGIPDEPGVDGGSGLGGTGLDSRGYRTLSSGESSDADANDVHVIFARGTDPVQVGRLLQSIGADIVAGPNGAGAYTLRLSRVSDERQREALIVALRKRTGVVFAEPVHPLAVPDPEVDATP